MVLLEKENRPMSNVVQAEYFHVGGEASSPLDVIRISAERAALDSRIKTTLRFTDPDGTIAGLATELTKLREDRETIGKRMSGGGSFFLTWMLRFDYSSISRTEALVYKKLRSVMMLKLGADLLTTTPVAIENPDRSFRLVRPDERHELLEAITAAKGDPWLFIFETDDLLASDAALVASLT